MGNELNELIDQNKSDIVLDLEGVVYISSVGLRVLLATQKKVRPRKGEVKLVSLQPFVREVFEMTGFTRLFSIYPTLEKTARSILLPECMAIGWS